MKWDPDNFFRVFLKASLVTAAICAFFLGKKDEAEVLCCFAFIAFFFV